MKENIAAFEEERPLDEKEMNALMQIADEKISGIGLPCTACSYCVSHCPQGLDIPGLLKLYNEHCSTAKGAGFIAPMALSAMNHFSKNVLYGMIVRNLTCRRQEILPAVFT